MDDSTDDSFTGFDMSSMLGGFGTSSVELSEEAQLAVNAQKAGFVLREITEYIEDNDEFNPADESMDPQDLTRGQQSLLFALGSLGGDVEAYAEALDDDDDDNPFKVSDGDDPIY
jgi:hypothetical protein